MQKICKVENILKKPYQIKKKNSNSAARSSTICKQATPGTANATKHIGSIWQS